MGTNWILASGDADAPTIEFSENRAFGYAGCNRWFAQVAVEGDTVTFTAIGSTRRMCEQAIMQAERAFLAALANAASARINGQELILRDAAGHDLQRFTRTG
jgi:heat shock protein HslJ